MKQIKVHLVLCGSFFPMHDGHLQLVDNGRKYVLDVLPWSSEVHVAVVHIYFLTTHPKFLMKKDINIDSEIDFWHHHRNRQMIKHINNRNLFQNTPTSILHNEKDFQPMAKRIESLRSIVESKSDENVVHKLIQVSGVDSRVQSIIKSSRKSIENLPQIHNSNKDYEILNSLNLVLVIDSRGVPKENKQVVDSYKYVGKKEQCPDLCGVCNNNLLPRHSSIQRFIEKDIYYPNADIDKMCDRFDLNWLLDTGITLGKGLEGIVRLMMLGGHEFVAVKVIKINSELRNARNRFHQESSIWRHLARVSPHVIPRLYTTKTITIPDTPDNDEFGIIVTEVGVPLEHIFPTLQIKPKKVSIAENHFSSFFNYIESVSSYTKNMELPFLPHSFIWLKSARDIDKEMIKRQLSKCLVDSLLPGLLKANVIHKDLTLENMLYLPSANKAVICDFGISLICNGTDREMEPGPRGSLKYYPILGIDHPTIYEPWFDAFTASLSLYEILTENRLHPGCDTTSVIELRRIGVTPCIDMSLQKKYFSYGIRWIEEIWKHEKKKRILRDLKEARSMCVR